MADASFERFDLLDLDAVLARKMRLWYLDLLDNAPLQHLVTTDIAPQLSFSPSLTTPVRPIWRAASIPPDVRRVVAVIFAHSPLPVPVTGGALTPEDLSLPDICAPSRPFSSPSSFNFHKPSSLHSKPSPGSNPATPHCNFHSKAVATAGRLIICAPAEPVSVIAVCDPGPDDYIFNESALSLIPSNLYPICSN